MSDRTDYAKRYGLSFNESDEKWYRLAGWGVADNWDIEPRVFVPFDHAMAILSYEGLNARISKLKAELAAAGGISIKPSSSGEVNP